MPPPARVTTSSGRELDLQALAEEASAAYFAELPEELERYGPAGLEWCRHDNQHLLNWAVLHERLEVDFEAQLVWLAGVLEARELGQEHLIRGLELLAATVEARLPREPELRERLLAGAAFLRSRRPGVD